MTASTDRLREAARVLRERAEAATPGPWSAYVSEYPDLGGDVADVTTRGCSCDYSCNRTDPRYIATMHPGVGLALADWLGDEADEEQYGHDPHDFTHPHRLADLILGAES